MPTPLSFTASALLSFVVSLAGAVFARGQGPLTPPGAPAPAMKTLDQIQPRIPIAGGTANVTISSEGSYYLTGNITVTLGDAITIGASNVTLDLCGFTLASRVGNSGGNGVTLTGNLTNISISNGVMQGGTSDLGGGHFSGGAGLYNGIYAAGTVANVRLTGLQLSNFTFSGIYLNSPVSSLVESCNVTTAANFGISTPGGIIRGCTATDCGNSALSGSSVVNSYGSSINGSGINAVTIEGSYGSSDVGGGLYASNIASNSSGTSGGSSDGVYAKNAINCNGSSNSAYGLYAEQSATGCTGTSTSLVGLQVNSGGAENCYGMSSGNQTGLYAVTAHNCTGVSAGSGIGMQIAQTATGCSGASASGIGLSAGNAENCRGISTSATGASNGLTVTSTATGCYGQSAGGTGLQAELATNCQGVTATGIGLHANSVATNCYGLATSASGTGISAFIANVSHGVSNNGGAVSIVTAHNINSF